MRVFTRHPWLIPVVFAAALGAAGWFNLRTLEATMRADVAEELKLQWPQMAVWVHHIHCFRRAGGVEPSHRRLPGSRSYVEILTERGLRGSSPPPYAT